MMIKRVVGVLSAATLAVSLMPAAAFAGAASLVAGDTSTEAAGSQMQTQAKTKTVYVISEIRSKETSTSSGVTNERAANMTYNGNGLLASMNTKQRSTGTSNKWYNIQTTKYAYKGTNLRKAVTTNDAKTFKVDCTYTLNSKGKWTKSKITYEGLVADGSTSSFKYNKAGNVSSVVYKLFLTDQSGKPHSQRLVYRYTYNKSGLCKKVKRSETDNRYLLRTFAYDKKGNITKETKVLSYNDSASVEKSTNTYKNGRLMKRVSTSSAFNTVTTFTYTKKKVKASVAAKIEAQQWALRNDNLNLAIKSVGD